RRAGIRRLREFAQAPLLQRGLELVLPQGHHLPAVVRHRMRCSWDGRAGAALEAVGTGRGARQNSDAVAAQRSEPDAAADGESRASARSAPTASRKIGPARALK